MNELTRLLMLVGVAGIAVTVLAGVARWTGSESRRIRRGLKIVLGGEVHGFLAALGRGRGVGFDFSRNQMAVVWDAGAWGLVYTLDELIGAEVIVDGMVTGRVHRGEPRLALNAFDAEKGVSLRLVFDDMTYPDFVLDLWLPEDEGRRHELPPDEAIAEANRWLARIEALLRRPQTGPRQTASKSAPTPAVAPRPEPEPELASAPQADTPLRPLFARLAEEDDHPEADNDTPPWEDEAEEDEIRSLRL